MSKPGKQSKQEAGWWDELDLTWDPVEMDWAPLTFDIEPLDLIAEETPLTFQI